VVAGGIVWFMVGLLVWRGGIERLLRGDWLLMDKVVVVGPLMEAV